MKELIISTDIIRQDIVEASTPIDVEMIDTQVEFLTRELESRIEFALIMGEESLVAVRALANRFKLEDQQ